MPKEKNGGVLPPDGVEVVKATWMADGTHWPGTWFEPKPDHSKGDHAGILQVPTINVSHQFVLNQETLQKLESYL